LTENNPVYLEQFAQEPRSMYERPAFSSTAVMVDSSSPRGRLLRYRADWWPVSVVVASFLVHVGIYLWATPVLALLALLPLFAISTIVAAFNHHHQHVNAFHSRILNRVYDLLLAVQTGVGPYTWVLHHNLGHHQNYLHQPPSATPDESHWTRQDGSTMGRVEYTLHTFLHHQVDVYRIGKKHPAIFRRYLLMKAPCYAFMAAGFWLTRSTTCWCSSSPASWRSCTPAGPPTSTTPAIPPPNTWKPARTASTRCSTCSPATWACTPLIT
jgi:hypothetical protein